MPDLVATRRSLHAVAELLLAGPQFRRSGTIRLTVTADGFGTVSEPGARVAGARLATPAADVPLDGLSVREVGARAGIAPSTLRDVYTDGCGLDETHVLRVDGGATAEILEAFRRGEEAMRAFAPAEDRVLWPEHFDLGTARDEVNYGVSPGDAFLAVPYAYVGPWERAGLDGTFWNAPFGAARTMAELEDVAGFFAEGADRLGR